MGHFSAYEVTFLNQFHDLVCYGSAPCPPCQYARHKPRPPPHPEFPSLDLPAYLAEDDGVTEGTLCGVVCGMHVVVLQERKQVRQRACQSAQHRAQDGVVRAFPVPEQYVAQSGLEPSAQILAPVLPPCPDGAAVQLPKRTRSPPPSN